MHWQDKKHRTIATGGTFRFGVTPGHLWLLTECSKMAGYAGRVHVYLNSDESLKRVKGQSGLIYRERDRIALIAALRMVDNVFLFEQDDPCFVLGMNKPDVWVKANGWDDKQAMPETSVVESYGGSVILLQGPTEFSTTKLIERICNG